MHSTEHPTEHPKQDLKQTVVRMLRYKLCKAALYQSSGQHKVVQQVSLAFPIIVFYLLVLSYEALKVVNFCLRCMSTRAGQDLRP